MWKNRSEDMKTDVEGGRVEMTIKFMALPLKLAIFVMVSALLVIYDVSLAKQHLYLVTVYIFITTIIMVAIQYRYPPTKREVGEITLVPRPAKKKGKDQKSSTPLKLSDILLNEFDYVKETASQAMNDRLTLVNYFLLSAGVVLAGFGLMVSAEGGAHFAYRYEVLIILSLIFNAVGWVYFMQVVRLRQAWCESALAMNHIKSIFTQNSEFLAETAKDAFLWRINTIPPPAKKMTVFYLSAVLISLLSAAAITLAGTISLSVDLLRQSDQIQKYINIPLAYPLIGLVLGLYHLFFQMSMYTALLKEPNLSTG